MASTPSQRRPRVLWDVLDEHLDEAAFLWVQRARALRSADYVLAEVEEGDEGRLRAHLEGLELGGEPAARRVLVPALKAEEPQRVAVAAWALLAQGQDAGLRAVMERLVEAPESRLGLLRALEQSERADLDGQLLSLFQKAEASLRAPLLEVLAFRGADASAALARLPLGEDAPDLLVAALRAARAVPWSVAEPWLLRGLEDPRPVVRNAALETGLIHGSRAAWLTCRRCVETNAPEPRPALLALALCGGTADLQLLSARASEPALRAEALWALGFSGRRAAAEGVLAALRLQAEPLAVMAFAQITGMPLQGMLEARAPEEAPEEGESLETAEDALAARQELPGPPSQEGWPLANAVEAWWQAKREHFNPDGRYWRGRPWTDELLPALLLEAPMNVRPILAWELAVRSRGACLLEPEAWGHVQRRHLREVRKLRLVPSTRAFERGMTP